MTLFRFRLLTALCLLLAISPAADAASRKEALRTTTIHLVKANLCAAAEGRDAVFVRAIEIGKRRLVRAGYGKAEANREVSALARKLKADRPEVMPYVRSICVGEIRALERT